MKNKNIKLALVSFAVTAFIFSFIIVNAETNANVKTKATSSRMLLKSGKTKMAEAEVRATSTATSTKNVKKVKGLDEAIDKADKEIEKRIENLEKVIEKIMSVKNISDSDKASLKSAVDAEITRLNTIKTKIDSSTDLKTIKSDLQTVISGSRINALVIPRINILASVGKVNTVSTMLETVAVKLQKRVDEMKALGRDTAKLEAAIVDIKTNTTSAKKEALSAETTVKALTADSGDKAKLADNNANLKSARENITKANQYLAKARKAAGTVTGGLKEKGEGVERATSTKATTTKATTTKAIIKKHK